MKKLLSIGALSLIALSIGTNAVSAQTVSGLGGPGPRGTVSGVSGTMTTGATSGITGSMTTGATSGITGSMTPGATSGITGSMTAGATSGITGSMTPGATSGITGTMTAGSTSGITGTMTPGSTSGITGTMTAGATSGTTGSMTPGATSGTTGSWVPGTATGLNGTTAGSISGTNGQWVPGSTSGLDPTDPGSVSGVNRPWVPGNVSGNTQPVDTSAMGFRSEATTGAQGNSWNNGPTWGGDTPVGNKGYLLPQTYQARSGQSGQVFYQGGTMSSGRQDATTKNSGTQRYQTMLQNTATTGLLAPNSVAGTDFCAEGDSGFPSLPKAVPFLGIYQGKPVFGGILPSVGTGSTAADITNGWE